jgi:predicted amidophosphoribosyltransferase
MTINNLLVNTLLPHYCCSCGEIGAVLCGSCVNDIVTDHSLSCIVCRKPCGPRGVCGLCRVPYGRAWHVGERTKALKALVDNSKFESVREGCFLQAELLDGAMPRLPNSACVVPVPTIAGHVRERGYGHSEIIAQELARRRGASYENCVIRRAQYVQRGASKLERREQAAKSFVVQSELEADTTYLIVDDVFTTGATIEYAARALKAAGARNIWVAVTSRQTFDE